MIRLDHFFFNESSFKMPTELQSVVKLILVLSNRQASVERGFNVNKTVLKVNINEKSVVSLELLIHHMQQTEAKETCKSCPLAVRVKMVNNRKRVPSKMNVTKQLCEACGNLHQGSEVEKKNDMRLVITGIGVKRKSEEEREEFKFWIRQSTFWKRNEESYSEQ